VLYLHNRLWWWRSRVRGNGLSSYRVTSPDEPPPVIIANWVHVEDFVLQIVEVVVIQIKAPLQCPIRHTSLTLEQFEDLGENRIEGHRGPFCCSDVASLVALQ
jgi:hypothetical protein